MISNSDLARFNAAAKMIEADADEAYYTCRSRYGADVAGALLVLYYRLKFNKDEIWPTPPEVEDKIENLLRDKGLLNNAPSREQMYKLLLAQETQKQAE